MDERRWLTDASGRYNTEIEAGLTRLRDRLACLCRKREVFLVAAVVLGRGAMRKSVVSACVLALTLCALAFFVPELALGDAGNFSGASDYGGDTGSSSDSDYGGDTGSSSDSDSGWIAALIYIAVDLLLEGEMSPGKIAILVVLALAILSLYVWTKARGKSGGKSSSGPKPQGAQVTAEARLRSCYDLSGVDPLFDPAKVEERLANIYVKIQNAWTDGDMEPVRPYFEDALFAQFERQLNALKSQGLVNHVDNVAVLECTARGWYKSEGKEYLVLKLRTRINDYTTDRTGAVVRGAIDRELFMEYEYALSRPEGTRTEEQTREVAVNQCPNCAAPLNEGASARCPYCGSVIAIKQHDWVISSIKGVSQQTV